MQTTRLEARDENDTPGFRLPAECCPAAALASVRLATSLWARAISGDKLLALALDDLDVPTLILYRILWDS